MIENLPGFAGIVLVLLVQIGHLLKTISDNKVVKTEIKNLTEQVKRQNGSIIETQKKIDHHIETCHVQK